jgi:hypothetical protein
MKRFAWMGGLDAIAGLLAAVGGSITAGQVQIVISQANIPLTMVFSRFYLRVNTYVWSQYIGASIIIIGGLISAMATGADDAPQRFIWYGSLLIFLAVIPGSMSNVYKEDEFKRQEIDVFFLSTYVSVWQMILSFACFPFFALPYFGSIPLYELPANLVDGWRCFMGEYVKGYACEISSPSSASLLISFVIVNFAYNLALLSMVKHGSALYLVIACAMALPLANLLFTQSWFMGSDVEPLSVFNMIGLALVVAGFLLYSLGPDSAQRGDFTGEFIVPTGPSTGHSFLITEFLPNAAGGGGVARFGGRRHSFDSHSSPSIRRVSDARKKRNERARKDKTPSRTP